MALGSGMVDAVTELELSAPQEQEAPKILVVDDDADQTLALSMRLGRLGYRTETAERGRDALEIARRERPALIVLDLQLPDVDGLHVCAELADAPETCGIPVIILSGMERQDVIRRARAAGCEYYVRKPYDPNALLTLIEQALRREQW